MRRRPSPSFDRLVVARALSLAVCGWAVGCGVDPCDPAINANGGLYDVYLGNPYPAADPNVPDAGAPGSCNGFDGVTPGATLTFETIGATETASQCRAAMAELLTGPSDLTPLPPPANPFADAPPSIESPSMEAQASVATGECSGTVVFFFYEDGGLYRAYRPATSVAACPPCADDFLITMIPL